VKKKIFRKYLEIKSVLDLKAVMAPSEKYSLFLVEKNNFQLNKFFYKNIGKKYNWVDRLAWSSLNWIEYISNKNLYTFALKENEDLVGYFELIFHPENKEVEIAYFGILEEYYGKKLGGYLLSEAIKRAFIFDIKRVWVHTCSLDHKNAFLNYISRGMIIFKNETLIR
jgi:GNAT superfamily N-acetyltransferase|tara:strand:- start:121 stop:624 length:504 start_codon:yes stop_codon:yes gene_type:complete